MLLRRAVQSDNAEICMAGTPYLALPDGSEHDWELAE
jgi:hypothetical protein